MIAPVAIWDIDGTIADLTHRLPFVKLMKGSRVKQKHTQGPYFEVEEVVLSAVPDYPFPVVTYVIRHPDHGSLQWSREELTFRPNWKRFFDAMVDDAPIQHNIDILLSLWKTGHKIQFVSGRPETHRAETEAWLKEHVLPPRHGGGAVLPGFGMPLMRKAEDFRPDTVVKQDILNELRDEGTPIQVVFDDRKRVVDMWRRNGIPCLQVADHDF